MTNYRDLLNVPYKVHGRTKEEGFDCYGLAIEILKRNGIFLPDVYYNSIENAITIENQLMAVIPSTKIDTLEELCIILFRIKNEPVHIGVYLGNGLFIHSTTNLGVKVEQIHKWKSRIMGLYKVNN